MSKVVSAVYSILTILSTLLIFVIPVWIVLIINIVATLLYRILFTVLDVEFTTKQSGILYITAGVLSIAIIVLSICFATNIYGVAEHLTDRQYIKNNLAGFAQGATTDGIIRMFRFSMGFAALPFLIGYIIVGIQLISSCRIVKDNPRSDDNFLYGHRTEILLSDFLFTPMTMMTGLIMCSFMSVIPWGISLMFIPALTVVNMIISHHLDVSDHMYGRGDGGGSDYGGGGGHSVNITITID